MQDHNHASLRWRPITFPFGVVKSDLETKAKIMNIRTLFDPIRLGAVEAPNRIVMAPLTRMRAGPGRTPTPLMVEYYAQRAAAGLIVTEATAVSQQGTGCPNTPGIYADEQVAGWQRVTEAVHHAGGRIFLQLWHMGRISHPSFQPGGGLPVAPSAIAPQFGQCRTETGMQPYVTPRALETEELPGIVAQYSAGAQRAKIAGFDGVEIHNANGYLLDQFLRDGTNRRADDYGGPERNRARLTLEVTEAVTKVWPADRVGIRFSPGGVVNDMRDSNPLATFGYVLRELNRFHLAYAHLIVSTEDDLRHGAAPVPLAALRQEFHGPLIIANGFDRATAMRVLTEGVADAVAFGRLFIANPDLPQRFRLNAPLNTPDESTFYGGAEKGYTDYPALGLGAVPIAE
jgi:N-ethylmaleimide reductase